MKIEIHESATKMVDWHSLAHGAFFQTVKGQLGLRIARGYVLLGNYEGPRLWTSTNIEGKAGELQVTPITFGDITFHIGG